MASRRLVVFLIFGLVVSACSSDAEDIAGPEFTLGSEPVGSPSPETTVAESSTGLESVLDGEPPSTTVSSDPDEQAAADVVHWDTQTFFTCYADIEECDPDDFSLTRKGRLLTTQVERFTGYQDRNEFSAPVEREPESRIIWARKSPTNPDVVGVLDCQRSYFGRVNEQGEFLEEPSLVELALNRVERGEDGKFRIVSFPNIEEFEPETEGGDLCSKYDGTEVPEELFNEILQ